MRALRPMTQEEREFAEQHHNLVIDFLRYPATSAGGYRYCQGAGKVHWTKGHATPGFERVAGQWNRGEITAAEAMRILKMSKTTFYRRVKAQYKVSQT